MAAQVDGLVSVGGEVLLCGHGRVAIHVSGIEGRCFHVDGSIDHVFGHDLALGDGLASLLGVVVEVGVLVAKGKDALVFDLLVEAVVAWWSFDDW